MLRLLLWTAGAVVSWSQQKPAFEVATIKLAAPGAIQNQMLRVAPNRISIPSMNLTWLIYTAYGEGMSTSISVRGVPPWGNQTAYAIEAQSAAPATQREFHAMLRTLLEERFKLKLHTETSEGEIFALVLGRPDGKLGPNVHEWDGTCTGGRAPVGDADDPTYPRCPSGYGGKGLLLEGASMFNVADLLSLPQSRLITGRVVQDRTGLTGRYRMDLEYRFPPPVRNAVPDTTQPSLFTVLLEQWGLKLEPARGPFKVIQVDEAQLPGDN